MATLTNLKIKDTYDGLLKTSNNEELGATGFTLIEDGLGNASSLSLGRAGNGLFINGKLSNSGDVYTSGSLFVASTLVLSSSRLLQNVTGNISMFTNDSGYLTSIPSEYLTQTEGDARYLQLTGGTLSGTLTATSFIKTGGTSSQFLKADGSVDSNTYLTSIPSEYLTQTEGDARYLQLTGGTLTGALNGTSISLSGTLSAYSLTGFGSSVTSSVATKYSFTGSTNEYLQLSGGNIGIFSGGSQTLTIDGTNQRLGINNTSPTQSLDVVGNIKFSGYLNDINISTVSGTVFIYSPNPIRFGTPSPLKQDVSVSGYLQTSGALRDSSGSDGTSGQVLTSTGTGTAWAAQTAGIGGSGTTGYLPKFTGTQTIGNSAIFDSSGNIGIGTTSPSYKLHVAGNSFIDATSSSAALTVGRHTGQPSIKAGSDDGGYLIMDSTGNTAGINWYSPYNVILANGGGKVGIGTTSPSDRLQIDAPNSQLRLRDTDDGTFTQFSSSGNKLAIRQNSTSANHIWLTSSGNVGIGTASPADKLHIEGNIYLGASNRTIYTGGSGNLTFQNNTGNILFLRSNGGSESMRITSTGNVGIGTTSPTELLHLSNGNLRIDGVNSNRASISLNENATDDNIVLEYDGTGVGAGNYFSIYSNVAGWVSKGNGFNYIPQNGYVGIGTTSPVNKLSVIGDIGYTGVIGQGSIYGNPNNSSYATMQLYNSSTGYTTLNNQSFGYYFNTGGGNKLTILNNGNVGIGTSSPSMKMHINGDTSAMTQVGISNTSTGGARIYFDASNGDFSGNDYFSIGQQNDLNGIIDLAPAADLRILTNGSERMRIDSSGNVGIGTTSPQARLHVSNASANNGTIHLGSATYYGLIEHDAVVTGSNKYTVASASGGGHIWYRGSTEQMRIDSSGNVGIGTNSPSEKLDVSGNIKTSGTMTAGGLSLSGDLNFGSSNAKINLSRGGFITFYENANADHSIGSRNNTGGEADDLRINSYGAVYVNLDSNNNNTSGADFMIGRHGSGTGTISELFRISGETGNVGIGTSSPSQKLYVAGGNIGTAGYAYINGGRVYTAGIQRRSKLHVWSGDPYGIGMQNGMTFGGINNDYAMTFQFSNNDGRGFWWGDAAHTNAQGAMALTTNGKLTVARGVRVGYGESDTTAPVGSNNAMEVTNELLSSGGVAIYAEANVNVNYGSAIKLGIGFLRQGMNVYSNSTLASTAATFNNINGTRGSITFDSTSTSYNTSSDYRLKENVVPMVNSLDKVSALKPSRFNFIIDSDKTVDGFLAHEVAEVVPEAVNGEKDAVDDNGNPIYQGIDQSKLVPLLVGAIQELKAEIELLKQQINK